MGVSLLVLALGHSVLSGANQSLFLKQSSRVTFICTSKSVGRCGGWTDDRDGSRWLRLLGISLFSPFVTCSELLHTDRKDPSPFSFPILHLLLFFYFSFIIF